MKKAQKPLTATQPTLETERLILRPLTLSDSAAIQHLANDPEIAANTLTVPHPYPAGAAEEFISRSQKSAQQGEAFVFAIVRKTDDALVGVMGLHLDSGHQRAEMGYWMGRPYRGQGYTTEAARRLLAYSFDELGINRVYAAHFAHNPASGRVMQKIGMTYEGTLRQHVLKNGRFVDVLYYGIVRSEYSTSS